MTPSARILIVDDEPMLLKATARIMSNAGYQVFEARTGKEGLAAARRSNPDLILLDVDLPDISGWEICRQIRDTDEMEGTYIIMLSSTRVSSDDQVIGLEFGADGYIARPIPNRELLARVNAMMRLKKTEEALRQSETRLFEAQKRETVGIMSRGIAHDYNNLLSVILGNIELAIEEIPVSHPARIFLMEAFRASVNATELTRKFLTISEGAHPRKHPGEILSTIREITAEIDPNTDRQVRFELDLPEKLPVISYDARMIKQAMGCLLNNALAAMPEGGTLHIAAGSVHIAESGLAEGADITPGDYIEIVISDTGVGIPLTALPKIFDPYYSTKERGSQKGMGLGLTVAYSIIVQHGGTIYVDSIARKGTRVTIYLPVL